MTEFSNIPSKSPTNHTENTHNRCIVHVCTSCRSVHTQDKLLRKQAGSILYQQLRDALNTTHLQNRVEIRPAECLSVCPRPCGIALSSSGAWTYLFGDQQPNETVHDIIKCISLYLDSSDGFMSRNERPISLQRSILGRIPPIRGVKKCT